MDKKIIKSAFTLVELIVVITILSVLSTVAFISFQGYASSSRDSVRLSDIKSMEKVINLYRLTNSRYPLPNNSTSITYSGSTAWIQGVFGVNSYSDNTNLSDIPVDPVTELPYTYSITNTKNEYQIAAVLEGEFSYFNIQTKAGNQIASVYVRGDYNGKIIKITNDSTDYLLGVPSIIASDITNVSLENILTNKKLVYKGYNNLPANYSGSIYNNNGGFNFGGLNYVNNDLIVYSGDVNTLSNDYLERVNFMKNIHKAYSGSIIETDQNFLNNKSLNDLNSTSISLINNVLNKNISNESILDWRNIDSNCSIPDLNIGGQTWAGCNSTIGSGSEYSVSNSCYNYTNGNMGISGECAEGDLGDSTDRELDYFNLYGSHSYGDLSSDLGWSDVIWGKLYTWHDRSTACGIGYRVPTDDDFYELEQHLGCTDTNTEMWRCSGLGWKDHVNKNETNNLLQALKIPLSGSSGGQRGVHFYLWSDTGHGSVYGLTRMTYSYSTGLRRLARDKNYGQSIRCISE